MKIGLVARCDDTGLGNQTLELAKILNPDHILVIDSSPFHPYNVQHPEWYNQWDSEVIQGIPDKQTVSQFIKKVDVIMSCETFYNNRFIDMAKQRGKKTILQYNFEFLEYLQDSNKTLPDILVAPSPWRIEEVGEKFGSKCRVEFIPPPTDHKVFSNNKIVNEKETKRVLHIGGKAAMHDRNGTQTVLEMMKYSKEDYELVIRSQSPLDFKMTDIRIKFLVGNEKKREDMYSGYDAMILPRRYAGLCLPMNEALLSGLPVFMTDISPNNYFLPERWLARSKIVGEFMTKTMLDIYEADPVSLAERVDEYMARNKEEEKLRAFEIGYENFSSESLKNTYLYLISSL
jgi:hypothetical protein